VPSGVGANETWFGRVQTKEQRSREIEVPKKTKESRTGKFLGVPYDWRRPTLARAKECWWNAAEPRLFVPKVFGWGWDINFARLLRRKPKS
jgi:hypothetical protein